MSDAKASSCYVMCPSCAHRIEVTDGFDKPIECDRCGHKNHRLKPKSAELTIAFSLTALIFYVPANIYPFMTIELYGNKNTSTIWSGIVSLADSGAWAIAAIVLLASLVIPFVKLIVLFYLAFSVKNKSNPRFKTRLYHIVEAIGRWSMLDIFLLAVLVAIVKLGAWATVVPEFGSLMFLFVVIFTMLASAYFDPQLLWEQDDDRK